MTKQATAVAIWCLAAIVGITGCGESDQDDAEARPSTPPPSGGNGDSNTHSPSPFSERTATDSANSEPEDYPTNGDPIPSLAPDTSPESAVQQFSQLLSASDTYIACGVIDGKLRSLFETRGPCPDILREIATDESYDYSNTACINDTQNFRVLGDPGDTQNSVRVGIDCPNGDGYTWVRVDRDGESWRVTDINNNG